MSGANDAFVKLLDTIAGNPLLFAALLLAALIMVIRQAALTMVVHAHISHRGVVRIGAGFWVHLVITCVLLVLVIAAATR